MSWLSDGAEDLVGGELADAERRLAEWEAEHPGRWCSESDRLTDQLIVAMRKSMDPNLQRNASALPLIVEVSEEEMARHAEHGLFLIPDGVSFPR